MLCSCTRILFPIFSRLFKQGFYYISYGIAYNAYLTLLILSSTEIESKADVFVTPKQIVKWRNNEKNRQNILLL